MNLDMLTLAHRVFPEVTEFQQAAAIAGLGAICVAFVTSFIVRARRSPVAVGIVWISLLTVVACAYCNIFILMFAVFLLFPFSLLSLVPFIVIAYNMSTGDDRVRQTTGCSMSISELEFFNNLSGRLEIELTEPAQPMAGLSNLQASRDAKVIKATLNAEVFLADEGAFRSLSAEELESIAYPEKEIKLRAESGDVIAHVAPNGAYFTVAELLKAVELTEQETRNNSEWFGGVDVHHCFFEGIEQVGDGVWEICWGS